MRHVIPSKHFAVGEVTKQQHDLPFTFQSAWLRPIDGPFRNNGGQSRKVASRPQLPREPHIRVGHYPLQRGTLFGTRLGTGSGASENPYPAGRTSGAAAAT